MHERFASLHVHAAGLQQQSIQALCSLHASFDHVELDRFLALLLNAMCTNDTSGDTLRTVLALIPTYLLTVSNYEQQRALSARFVQNISFVLASGNP